MNWMLTIPEMHSKFSLLGLMQGDTYITTDETLGNLNIKNNYNFKRIFINFMHSIFI